MGGGIKTLAKFLLSVLAVFLVVFVLKAQVAEAVCPYPTNEEVRQCADTQGLARGSRCQRVCDLQDELRSLEFYSSEIDGQYGPETAAAVTEYQKSKNLKVDGIAGTETLSALGLQTPKKNDTSVPARKDEPTGGGSKEFCDTASGRYVYENGLCLLKSEYAAGSIAGSKDLPELVARVLKWLLGLAGLIAVVAMVFGGYLYLTAAGSEEQSEKGKKALINSTIGLVVILMAYAIVTIIVSAITSGR